MTREDLLHLLAEALEFEHNLLCCYLYAAFSLKRAPDATLAPAQLPAVEAWRESILAVAVQEMGHMALVANLTVAVGGRPHFNRPNLPVAPGYHPAGMVIELAPFDPATLDHFIFLEQPADGTLPDGAGFEAATHYARGARAGAGLMPGAVDYGSIGEFYESIREALTSACKSLGAARLFTNDPMRQVGPDVLELDGLVTIVDLDSALAALDRVVVEGEGASGSSEESHYARFRTMKDEFDAMRRDDAAFAPAHPVARNPVMRRPIDTGERVHVVEPQAAAVLDAANAVYNHMLRLLGQAYGRQRATLSGKKALLEAAMGAMHALAALGSHLATLPANAAVPGVNAGMTFTMLRATEPMVEDEGEWARLAERCGELALGIETVCGNRPGVAGAAEKLRHHAAALARARN